MNITIWLAFAIYNIFILYLYSSSTLRRVTNYFSKYILNMLDSDFDDFVVQPLQTVTSEPVSDPL